MKELRKKTIKLFLFSIVCINIVTAVTDGIFEFFLRMYPDQSLEFKLIGFLNIFISLVYIYFTIKYFQKKISVYFEEEIHRQMDRQNLLYSSLIHDIKTPLTSVLGFSSALVENRVEEEALEKTYQTIHRKSQEMSGLINDLFAYSKMSIQSYNPVKTRFNVSEILKETLALNFDNFEKQNIGLEIAIEDKIFYYGVAMDFQRLFENLIINAVKHNPLKTQVKVSLSIEKNQIVLVVADSGHIIAQEAKDRIFRPFYKGDQSRKTGSGSGLGLSIVQMIAEKNQGRVTLEDDYPGYTKAFIVTFPCKFSQEQE